MPNSIPDDQITEPYLDLLAASSQAYGDRSQLLLAQALFALSSALLGPLLGFVKPEWKVWGAFWAIGVLVLDEAILEPLKEELTKTGSKIQELFDTKLFRLPWNKLKCGSEPQAEALDELMRKYKAKHADRTEHQNWYPARIGGISLPLARLICQRANLVWDAGLRKKYVLILKVILFASAMILVATGLAMRETLDHFVLSIFVPVLPAVRRLYAECKNQVTWMTEGERITSHLESLWDSALKPPGLSDLEFLQESRRLQDETFERRRRSPRVPSRLHNRYRNEYQQQMDAAARKYTEAAAAFENPKTQHALASDTPAVEVKVVPVINGEPAATTSEEPRASEPSSLQTSSRRTGIDEPVPGPPPA